MKRHDCTAEHLLEHACVVLREVHSTSLDVYAGPCSPGLRCVAIEGRLIMLADRATALAINPYGGISDVPAQAFLREPNRSVDGSDDDGAWCSIRLIGWVSEVASEMLRPLADLFAQQLPVGELLDVGREWTLLTLDVAETELRSHRGTMHFDAEASNILLTMA